MQLHPCIQCDSLTVCSTLTKSALIFCQSPTANNVNTTKHLENLPFEAPLLSVIWYRDFYVGKKSPEP